MKTSKSTYKYNKSRHKNQERRNKKSKAKKRARNTAKNEKKQRRKTLVFRLYKTIMHHFPNLFEEIRQIEDCRKKGNYELVELIMAAISMFIFKEGSRNAFNNEREEEKFKRNYEKTFKMRLPHMDTVECVLRQIDDVQLEKLKTELVKQLIEKKLFYKHRFLGKYYLVVIDASHVMTVEEGHCEHCLYRTSKNGKVTYFHNVLEAKLVSSNGFCISLATEWILNIEGDFDKQDCELKAFKRLAEKLKKAYPRLPICIVADGLYPNKSFFQICKDNHWSWIVTFKDGNLPSVWKEILDIKDITTTQNMGYNKSMKNGKQIEHKYMWINGIDYCGFTLNWFECIERIDNKSRRFVYISSLEIDCHNILEMTKSGRMRWKIENEGFNIQKNQGYGLGHKYSRVSMRATKNYYQCMQIAHMINQLFELGSLAEAFLKAKKTVKHLWKVMLGELRHTELDFQELELFLSCKIQIRYG